MNLHATFGICALSLSALSVGAAEDKKPDFEEVAATFRSKCQHCHTVPDARREFDRAWLGQVQRTA
jgi:hypothetical protein